MNNGLLVSIEAAVLALLVVALPETAMGASKPEEPGPAHAQDTSPKPAPEKKFNLRKLFNRTQGGVPLTPRTLMDTNHDGKINYKDLFRALGLNEKVEHVVTVNSEGQPGIRDPRKLAGDALIDFAEDGKIDLKDPLHLLEPKMSEFTNTSRLSLQVSGVRYERRWSF